MELIERYTLLLECSTEMAWVELVFRLGKDYGFDRTLIAVVPDCQTPLEKAFLRSNYSPDWRNVYDSAKLVYIDPTVAHCTARSTPLIWEPNIFASEPQKTMYEEACGYGLRSGLTLPFHGVNGELGILCFVNDTMPSKNFERETAHAMPDLTLMRDFAFESSLKFATPSLQMRCPRRPAITCRELECLKWGAAGKSSWEIARILHCSESTINFHFGNIRRKFDATTRRQAIVKAIRLGLI